MESRRKPGSTPRLTGDDQAAAREVLGHLNFSSGRRDSGFLSNLNRLWAICSGPSKAAALVDLLDSELDSLAESSAAFADSAQARQVITLVLDDCVSAYREHHKDLLFHLGDDDFEQPYFLGALFEAVLAQGGPWEETARIIGGAIRQVNDFLGYRPIAILDNNRKMEPYAHERFRPLPVYIAGAGVAQGPYHDLIEQTIALLKSVPAELLEDAHFRFANLDELAVDLRAHDHLHPVNKRTNYMFGEWDPHVIDNRGVYRRFIIRKVILDTLAEWVDTGRRGANRKERLFDAAAALCGTMLMASSISGEGPATHDSTVSLTSLLPIVARQRDAFYARLMDDVDGARARRLEREEHRTQQPFGHVRQFLNMRLARYGASQVQHRELAYLYAQMGFPEAAREQASAIPAASIRFECEIHCQCALARLELNRGRLPEALEHVFQLDDLLRRGIDCGALIDPWNFLGFHGQFPLFASREDAIPDNRVETMLELMEAIFTAYTSALAEAASQGDETAQQRLVERFRRLGEWWDQFGSDVIDDLPEISGQLSCDAAVRVAAALAQWRSAGAAAGDIGYWRSHVDQFESAQAYAQVVTALMEKRDHVAAIGLLMEWLSRLDDMGLESSDDSIFGLLIRWMRMITAEDTDLGDAEQRVTTICRMFDYLEANAEELWSVPRLDAEALRDPGPRTETALDDDEEEESDDGLYGAAYENVVYRDSTDDGNWSDTLDGDRGPGGSELEAINRACEPRLKFIIAVGQMWQMASLIATDLEQAAAGNAWVGRAHGCVAGWLQQCRTWESDLTDLMRSVWKYEVAASSGDHDANVEFDLQLQVKFHTLNQIIVALVCLQNSARLLRGCLPTASDEDAAASPEQVVAQTYAAVVRRDAKRTRQLLPGLCRWLRRQPLLYVPFEHGGRPEPLLQAQSVHSIIRFLLQQLPALGLVREGWHVLQTAYEMEQHRRPDGQAITEFDRLFYVSLRGSLAALLHAAERWRSGRFTDEELIDILNEMVDPYQSLWSKHSKTMRLSSVDGIRTDEDWRELAEFVHRYGAQLFHSSQLTLGNVRAILHNGVDRYLDFLAENEDPLHPIRLLADIREGRCDRDDALWCLESIYAIVVDRFDRFLDYNTTTTQSDYGEMFFSLLEFLRVETQYDRHAWHMTPSTIVHEVLAREGRHEAADAWSATFEIQTADLADEHLQDLDNLEQRYGMQMPTIRDHLNQRFVKPLAVNRMLAHVAPAINAAATGDVDAPSITTFRQEVEAYLADSWGSGVDVPNWLRTLENEVESVIQPSEAGRPSAEAVLEFTAVNVSLREFRQQLRKWREPLTPSPTKQSSGRQPRSGGQRKRTKRSGRKKPKSSGE